MEFMPLNAYLLGDRSACRPVRLLSVAEGDAKRLSRKRAQLKKERTRHVNRIRALLVLHGIRSVPGLWGGRWSEAVSNIRTGIRSLIEAANTVILAYHIYSWQDGSFPPKDVQSCTARSR